MNSKESTIRFDNILGLTQLNARSQPPCPPYQEVRGRFIAAQDNFQRPMNRATTVGPWGPVMFRREQRSLFPTEVCNS